MTKILKIFNDEDKIFICQILRSQAKEPLLKCEQSEFSPQRKILQRKKAWY